MKIGIVGSKSYVSETPIKDFIFKCIQAFNPNLENKDKLIFYTLGDGTDVGKLVKKSALVFGAQYGEYNPAYEKQNLYSLLDEDYYEKKFHPSHFWHSIQCLVMNSDRIFVFVEKYDENNKLWKDLYAAVKKYNKKVVFLK